MLEDRGLCYILVRGGGLEGCVTDEGQRSVLHISDGG